MKKKILMLVCSLLFMFSVCITGVGCNRSDPNKKAKNITVTYSGMTITSENQIIDVEYDSVNLLGVDLLVKLVYDDGSDETLNKKTSNKCGYVLMHNIPETITESEIGKTYPVSVLYSDYVVSFNIHITKKYDILNIELADKEYDGEVIDYSITKLNPDEALIKWYTSDGQEIASAPQDAGTYYVVVSTHENAFFIASTIRKDFTINKANPVKPDLTAFTGSTYSPTQKLKDFNFNVDGLSWKDENIVPTCNITEYKAVYNPDDKNYNDIEFDVTLRLQKATPVFELPVFEEVYYTNDPNTKRLNEISLENRFSWKEPYRYLSVGKQSYALIYNPEDEINYSSVEMMVSVNVKAILSSPIADKTYSYTGMEQTFDLKYNDTRIAIDDECDLTQTDAGIYDIKVNITDTDKYCWEDKSSTITIQWVINEYTPGLQFEFNSSDNSYTVTKFSGTSNDVVIPVSFKSESDEQSFPVKRIAKDAFYKKYDGLNLYFLTPVTIENGAFTYENINISKVVTSNMDVWYGMKFYGPLNNPLSRGVALYDGNDLVTTVTPNILSSYMFYGCTSITKIDLSNLQSDNTYQCAFENCENIEEIVVGDNVFNTTIFGYDNINLPKLSKITQKEGDFEKLKVEKNTILDTTTGTILLTLQSTDFEIDGATKLNMSAFALIENKITQITIPSSITQIDGCEISSVWKNLTQINFANINQCLSIDNMVCKDASTIDLYVAGNKVTNVVIPSEMTTLKDHILTPYNLESITLHKNIQSIGTWSAITQNLYIEDFNSWLNVDLTSRVMNATNVYFNNERLTTLTIPSGVTEIKPYTFAGLHHITTLELPVGLTKIGIGAFSSCVGLVDVKVPSVKDWLLISFGTQSKYEATPGNPLQYAENLYANGQLVTEVDTRKISGITEISNSAFYGYEKLTMVIISSEIKRIGSHAFFGCNNITGIAFETTNNWKFYYNDNQFYEDFSIIPQENMKYFSYGYEGYIRTQEYTHS